MAELAKKEKNALAEYEITPAKIKEMAKEYMTITVPEDDSKAYKVARKALTICVTARTGTDKRRKELGEHLRNRLGDINSAGKQLIAALAPVEEHLRIELDREDTRKETIKEAAYQKELKRVEDIREKIATITSFSASLNWQLTADELTVILKNIDAIVITPDEYMELTKEANQVKYDVHIAIQRAIEAREKLDAEEVARKAEDERLAKEKARLAKIKTEQEATQKAIDEENAKIVAEKNRLEREEFERKAMIKADLEAERKAHEKLEREVKEKEEREKAEAEERARQEALKPDKEKLNLWIDQVSNVLFNHPEEGLKSLEASKVFNVVYERIEGAVKFAQNMIEKL